MNKDENERIETLEKELDLSKINMKILQKIDKLQKVQKVTKNTTVKTEFAEVCPQIYILLVRTEGFGCYDYNFFQIIQNSKEIIITQYNTDNEAYNTISVENFTDYLNACIDTLKEIRKCKIKEMMKNDNN